MRITCSSEAATVEIKQFYLNEGWSEENGGWLALWDREMKACVNRVLPVFNPTVIFSTASTSYHGQPDLIVGPPNLWRKSLT